MALLGIDIGTTHCKAGVFDVNGSAPLRVIRLASRPTPTQAIPDGRVVFDPEALWQAAASAIREVADSSVQTVGVASMAETGVLLDRRTGQPRSPFLPWFDQAAAPQAERLRTEHDPLAQFARSGIRASFKCPVAKLLWLRDSGLGDFAGAVWLSAADYVMYRLTGRFITAPSLAGRTYAYDIRRHEWDAAWLDALNLPADLFPTVQHSGTPAGEVLPNDLNLPEAIPASVAGHDHVCAALAVGAVAPGIVFDSMGTAETLVGALEQVDLSTSAYESGLSYGCHVLPRRYYWMGGISASGGSVEWLRQLLSDPALTYEQVSALAESVGDEPTGILYYPYLAGSGIPRPNAAVRASFVGLGANHGRGHVLRAALEGVSYELESIRREAERTTGHAIESIIAVGGGTRNRAWMQIKADITNCRFEVYNLPEATLLGAALCAGSGANLIDPVPPIDADAFEAITPDAGRHAQYRRLYEDGYLALQQPLNDYFQNRKSDETT
ncbi:MAG: FGGY family carbohydrate kinase [bacterium]|nr:FGGY family carbohydrate kinase [bacterium]